MQKIYTPERIIQKAKALYLEERGINRLDGWLIAREAAMSKSRDDGMDLETYAAQSLRRMVESLPLSISDNSVFVGTQRDAFARTYALINPAFQVETFSGYCDLADVFNDVAPDDDFSQARINALSEKTMASDYARELKRMYNTHKQMTDEVVFFVEQVTGHVIPDFRFAIQYGIDRLIELIEERISSMTDLNRIRDLTAMKDSLHCAVLLAERYLAIAEDKIKYADNARKPELELIISTLKRVPRQGAKSLYEAMQSFILLWQVMCLEQAPNPFAFSVGNADRIFEPYRKKTRLSRDEVKALFCCFLVFFNVGDRSWAISQNILIGGRALDGGDLTNETSYALLDAYYEMNLPQPILSVKLHKNTPDRLYESLGRFFFTPGMLTPSLFNDDVLFSVLRERGVAEEDLPDYAIAGCQEPLIMGNDNGNTTNSWLNMPKVLELVLNGGKSLITGKMLMEVNTPSDAKMLLKSVRPLFYQTLEKVLAQMSAAANGATQALANLRVPFLSCFMGGIATGVDMRDTSRQGTKYNGSGCLIHGLSVIADSFTAIDQLLNERPNDCQRLLDALRTDFRYDDEMRAYLRACPKYGNNLTVPDQEAGKIADRVSDMVNALRNNWNNPFRADWSSPSTHLLYGYWVGAMPDGRKAREMLGYGVDPLYGDANSGMGFRTLSAFQLPYKKFSGGCACHFGIDPKYFTGKCCEEKGLQIKTRVLAPLFFNSDNPRLAPFYLYMNITTPETLRKVLADPKKYAPSGVYIMRIHGTFVNFLDLSPAIQQDIIKRLDMASTSL